VVGVLLAGGLKPSPLQRACDRHVLDLHIRPGVSLLDHWLDRFEELRPLDSEPVPLSVLHSPSGPTADVRSIAAERREAVEVRREADAFRGPAGAIRDLCLEQPHWRAVLAVEAVRFMSGSIAPILEHHLDSRAWATLGVNPDGTPAGVYVLSREALALVPRSGFLDLKEQLLAKVRERGGRVRGWPMTGPGGMPVRTREQFVRALAVSVSEREDDRDDGGRYGARPESATDAGAKHTSVASPGCEVADNATLLRSLVMPDARVEEGAVVARSILLPGALVRAGEAVVDSVVTSRGVVADEPATRIWRKRA